MKRILTTLTALLLVVISSAQIRVSLHVEDRYRYYITDSFVIGYDTVHYYDHFGNRVKGLQPVYGYDSIASRVAYLDSEISAEIYPTIVSDEMNIKVIGGNDCAVNVEIYSLDGQRVFCGSHEFYTSHDQSFIIADQFPQGMYIVKLYISCYTFNSIRFQSRTLTITNKIFIQ